MEWTAPWAAVRIPVAVAVPQAPSRVALSVATQEPKWVRLAGETGAEHAGILNT